MNRGFYGFFQRKNRKNLQVQQAGSTPRLPARTRACLCFPVQIVARFSRNTMLRLKHLIREKRQGIFTARDHEGEDKRGRIPELS
jgi:hypothetical protein